MSYQTISIVVPIYNEVKTLEPMLKRLEVADIAGLKKEIILVDDGSTDGTRELLHKLEITGQYKILYHDTNRGKGAALRTGYKQVTGDIVAIQDADLEYDPAELSKLVVPIIEDRVDVVYGSRMTGHNPSGYWYMYLGNYIISLLARLLYGRHVSDVETCYKVFKRSILDKISLTANSFDIEVEFTVQIIKHKFRYAELPIVYVPRHYDAGKKISWKDGLQAIWLLFKYRLQPKEEKTNNKNKTGLIKRSAVVYLTILTLLIYLPIITIVYQQEQGIVPPDSYAVQPDRHAGNDAGAYVRSADNLISRGMLQVLVNFPDKPETKQTPGYPLFLAATKLIFNNFNAVLGIQILLVILAALMIARLGAFFFSATVGLIAATMFVIDPTIIGHALIPMSEILFVTLVLATFSLFFTAQRHDLIWLTMTGLLLGYTILVRPIAIFLPIIYSIVFYLLQRNKLPVKQIILAVITFMVASYLVVVPWVIRNYRVSGVAAVSSVSAFNMFWYNVPSFLAVKNKTDLDAVRTDLTSQVSLQPGYDITDLVNAKQLSSVAWKYVAEDPLGYIQFHAIKTLPVFFSSGLAYFEYQFLPQRSAAVADINVTSALINRDFDAVRKALVNKPLVTAEYMVWGLIILAGLLGLLFSKKKGWFLLFWLLILYFAFLTGLVAEARFRIPGQPFLLLIGVQGFILVFNKIKFKISGN